MDRLVKGLAEGMELNTDKREGKLLAAIIDVLEDIALELEDIQDEQAELADGLDAVSDDLEDVEDVSSTSMMKKMTTRIVTPLPAPPVRRPFILMSPSWRMAR